MSTGDRSSDTNKLVYVWSIFRFIRNNYMPSQALARFGKCERSNLLVMLIANGGGNVISSHM
jgi:hypothetical protein